MRVRDEEDFSGITRGSGGTIMAFRRSPVRWLVWSAVSGVVSASAFLAVAELLALAVAREGSPLLAVGSFVIDIVPQPVKEFAIASFGDYDKIVLLLSLGVAVIVAAAIAGALEYLRRWFGVGAFAVAGALSAAAILTRAGATTFALVPPLAGTVAGGILVFVLVRLVRRWRDAIPVHEGAGVPTERRLFLRFAGLSAAAAVVIGVGARAANAATSSVANVRRALRLPAPGTTVALPEGAELDVPGITPLITSNADFYRVDTALTVPSVDPAAWRLVVDGMVDRRVELSFDDLVGMGLDEYAVTLTCVSNEVGGELAGTAIWQGVPLRDVLAMARPQRGADMVLSRSVDGYTASTPLSALVDDGRDAILAVAMNGAPLPLEHGFPVRMVVPGLYGYVSATKWVTELKVTTFAADEAYWTPRGYSAEAPIKMSSRIDTPRSGTPVPAGRVAIAGVAWAQTVGIGRVEVQVDDGDWQRATLSNPINADTWVQWMVEWEAEPGTHYVTVRAVDANGDLQIEERAPIAPNGSSGWQRTLITVS